MVIDQRILKSISDIVGRLNRSQASESLLSDNHEVANRGCAILLEPHQ